MKLAFLIQCHKNPKQIIMLIESLSHPDIDFYVHIDKKSKMTLETINRKYSNVFILSDKERVDVRWGTFSQVQATLNLLKRANEKKYDYYWLISGQDFPIVTNEKIIAKLTDAMYKGNNYVNLFYSKNNGAKVSTNFDKRNDIVYPTWMMKQGLKYRIIRRTWVELTGGYKHTFSMFQRSNNDKLKYYFGSSWWCIDNKFAYYILNYIEMHPEYISFFEKASCPDESFFQTLLMNSEFASSRKDYLHYIDWSEGKSSPKTLRCSDLENVFQSKKLMARKIDMNYDKKIIDEILKRINYIECGE